MTKGLGHWWLIPELCQYFSGSARGRGFCIVEGRDGPVAVSRRRGAGVCAQEAGLVAPLGRLAAAADVPRGLARVRPVCQRAADG